MNKKNTPSPVTKIKNKAVENLHAILVELISEGALTYRIEKLAPKLETYLGSARQDKNLKKSIQSDLLELLIDKDLLHLSTRFIELLAINGILDIDDFPLLKAELMADYRLSLSDIDQLHHNTKIQLVRVVAALEKYSDPDEQEARLNELLSLAEHAFFATSDNALQSLIIMSAYLTPQQKQKVLSQLTKIKPTGLSSTALNQAIIAFQPSTTKKHQK